MSASQMWPPILGSTQCTLRGKCRFQTLAAHFPATSPNRTDQVTDCGLVVRAQLLRQVCPRHSTDGNLHAVSVPTLPYPTCILTLPRGDASGHEGIYHDLGTGSMQSHSPWSPIEPRSLASVSATACCAMNSLHPGTQHCRASHGPLDHCSIELPCETDHPPGQLNGWRIQLQIVVVIRLPTHVVEFSTTE